MEVSTPLHRAAWTNENLAVLEALLAADADVSEALDLSEQPGPLHIPTRVRHRRVEN